MNPSKVNRATVRKLTDLPNIGKAGAADLRVLGITSPDQLIGRCPFEMHKLLCEKTGVRHDPCVIDVFMSVTRFMAGEDARVWWDYTDARKLIQGASK
jgi:Pathogenicity locus